MGPMKLVHHMFAGAEWLVLTDWYKSVGTLPVGQLLVEFHFEGAVDGLEGTIAPLFEMLADDGFRVIATEPNTYCANGCCGKNLVEYSFIKVSKHGRIYGANSHESSQPHNTHTHQAPA